MRLPVRFLGILDFPYLKLGIRDFKAKSGGGGARSRFGIESMRAWWDRKNNHRGYGIARNFGVGITGLKRGTSQVTHQGFISPPLGVLEGVSAAANIQKTPPFR